MITVTISSDLQGEGKTTLGRMIFDLLSDPKNHHMFLEPVRPRFEDDVEGVFGSTDPTILIKTETTDVR